MAYFRDDCYLFQDGEHFHIWVRDGYDSWRESGWAAMTTSPESDSGVQLSVARMDQFVLMRLAEMLVEKTATTTLESMDGSLFSHPGNVGEGQLRQNLACIRKALQELEARCLASRQED